MRVVVLVMMCCGLFAPAARGQVAAVRGVVVDDSGGVLPGATIVLASDGVNPHETTTDATGSFVFPRVDFGSYRLRVELAGFQPADLKVPVAEREPPPLRVRLIVGFGDEVTVKGDESGGVLSPARNADAIEFDPEALRQLPTDMQNLQALVATFTTPEAIGGVSFVVDGVETDAADIPTAAIYRLRINRSPYAVEYKSPGKARVEVETQHGSRRFFHGSGALFVRNSALDSKNALALTMPDMQRLLSEGTFGGPIPRKGWSFFASGQQLTSDDAAVINAETAAGLLNANAPTTERRTTLFGRVDVRPGRTQSTSLRYNLFDDVERGRGIGGLRLAEQAYATTERRQHLTISDHRVWSGRLVNDINSEVSHSDRQDGALATGPSIVVAGAFAGGASQIFTANRSTSVQGADIATITIGSHAMRLGGRAKARSLDVVDGSNFGGTYSFASLSDYTRGRPTLFTLRRGNPRVSFTDVDASVFAEIDFRPLDTVGIVTGVRYDWESAVHDSNNVAPRVSLAYAPAGRKFVIRSGVGVYYQSLAETAIARSLLFGSGGLQEFAIEAPPYPPAAPAAALRDAGLTVWQLDPALQSPATIQASIGIERPLTRKSMVSVEYLDTRASGVFRARDINAPLDGTGLRPDRARSNVDQIESAGSGHTHALTTMFRGRVSEFKGSIQYVWSRTIDDTSGIFDLPANSRNFAAERGRADFDRRHRLNVAGAYAWAKDRMRLATRLSLASGAPFDVTTGSDDNHDLVVNDRPAGVTRNTGNGPGLAQVDLRFTTIFRAPRPRSADPESSKRDQVDNLELNLDVFNALNAVDASTVVGVVSSPLFGRAATVRPARSFQLSMRYRF